MNNFFFSSNNKKHVREPRQKNVFFKDFVLNCGWVGVKSPKLLSAEKQCHVYMAYFTILSIIHDFSPKKRFYLGLCPKLWVGGGQESKTF